MSVRERVRIGCLAAVSAVAAARCGGNGEVVWDLAALAPQRPVAGELALGFDAHETEPGMFGEGWSDAETAADGRTFRWTVGRSATLDLLLSGRQDKWLHLTCWPFAPDPTATQTLAVSFNGTAVGRVVLARDLGTYTVRLPAAALRRGANRIELRFAHAERPSRWDRDNPDERELAVAFDALTVSSDADPQQVHEVAPDRLAQAADTEWAFPLIVPHGARFEFGLATEPDGAGADLEAEVALRDESGAERVLLRRAAGARRHGGVSLSRYADRRVELVLRVVGEGPGRMVWQRPHVRGMPEAIDRQRDVILIVVDTLRADFVGAYGGAARTPTIDGLAARGVLFRRAYAHAPITAPSHAALLASGRPVALGVRNNQDALPPAASTLAELLQATGRRTAAFVSLGVLSERFGTAQGFDEYHDRFGRDWWKSAGEVNRELLPWLERHDGRPLFLWTHYSDPHEPYAPPDGGYPRLGVEAAGGARTEAPIDGSTTALPLVLPPGRTEVRLDATSPEAGGETWLKNLLALDASVSVSCIAGCRSELQQDGAPGVLAVPPATLALDNPGAAPIATELRFRAQARITVEGSRERYRAEVEYCDRQIGHLLDALERAGRLERALVVLTSDHGEGLGDHGLVGHVHQLYDTLLRVPLIVALPGRLPAGAVVDEPVSLGDVLPTMLDLLAVPDALGREGRSLVPLATGRSRQPPRPIFAETFRPQARRDLDAVIEGRFKLIAGEPGSPAELYDLSADPGEVSNLSERFPGIAQRLERLLHARRPRVANATAAVEPSAEDLERLRALGYVN